MRLCLIGVLIASCGAGLCADPRFPQVRVSTTSLQAIWAQSPIVVVGEVTNISSYGEQTVDRLPPPTAPEAHKLYWCQGELLVMAVVKGELPVPPRKYLWASTIAGCRLYDTDPEHVASRYRTRAWFVREEGDFLRPTFDYGTHRFVGLCATWQQWDAQTPRQELGALLLTPTANCGSILDYAQYFLNEAGDLACEVLGESECIPQIKKLARSGSEAMRTSACEFLRNELRKSCK